MSRKLIIPGVSFTGPKLKADPILTPGSLLLVDPTHPYRPWAAGTLNSASVIPNIADTFARATINPALAAGATDGKVTVVGATNKQARSGKGAWIWAKSGAGSSIHLPFPVEILRYMIANPTHHWFFSWWGGTTYSADTVGISGQVIRASASASLAANDVMFAATGSGVTGAELGNYSLSTSNTDIVPRRYVGASSANSGALDQTAEQAMVQSRYAGLTSPNFVPASGTLQMLFQRFYLEDLTVSGRSYVQVKALDDTLYADTVTAAAGRYGADPSYGVNTPLVA